MSVESVPRLEVLCLAKRKVLDISSNSYIHTSLPHFTGYELTWVFYFLLSTASKKDNFNQYIFFHSSCHLMLNKLNMQARILALDW